MSMKENFVPASHLLNVYLLRYVIPNLYGRSRSWCTNTFAPPRTLCSQFAGEFSISNSSLRMKQ